MDQDARRIAIVNAGSATLKTGLFETRGSEIIELSSDVYDWAGDDRARVYQEAIASILQLPDAVGHRFVHGGIEFVKPVEIDDNAMEALRNTAELAPLHNPPALTGIDIARQCFPEARHFALFDTEFHAGRSEAAMRCALPHELEQRYSLRRFGFHGFAHAALVDATARHQGIPKASVDAVTLQLGAGVSACAVQGGRSIETTMGYSPLDGLVMATRCGSLDPAIVLALIRQGLSAADVENTLNNESGLLGLCGRADIREILTAKSAGDERAKLAVELFVRRIVMAVGAYFTLLNGRGALVFGGGIGTHSPEIREQIAAGLKAWDIDLAPAKNEANNVGSINVAGHRDVFVFATNEHAAMATEIARLIRKAG